MSDTESSSENKDLYEILGVPEDAEQDQIKKAYRKLALQFHPDKASDDDNKILNELKFKDITAAYQTLSDESKRKEYDNKKSYEQYYDNDNGPNNHNSHQYNSNKSKNEETKLKLKTSDLYNGKTLKFNTKRNIICKKCSGLGWRNKKDGTPYVPPVIDCNKCNSMGYKEIKRQIAPGFFTKQNVMCSTCHGMGKYYKKPNSPKNFCKDCNANCMIIENTVLTLSIPRGTLDGDIVTLGGKADEEIGKLGAGDLIFVVDEILEPNLNLERYGPHILTHLTISLSEAITGLEDKFIVKTFDGRDLKLTTPKGKVIRPGDIIQIEQEGWPLNSYASKFGDLFILINIEFPPDNWMTEKSDVVKIRNILPNDITKQVVVDDPANTELVTTFNFIKELPELKSDGNGGDYNTFDGTPQCAQQ